MSKPPFLNISGNSFSQSKAKSFTNSLSFIREFPHFILFSNVVNVLFLLALFNHRDNFVISTLSLFKSTPKILFSSIYLVVSEKRSCSPVKSRSFSSIILVCFSKNSKAVIKNAPEPQAGSKTFIFLIASLYFFQKSICFL